jgi:thermitase
MKPHIILKTISFLSTVDDQSPYWVDFINDKTQLLESLHPEVDSVLDDHNIKFWVTNEYDPAGDDWSTEEKSAGLDRIYRIILRRDYHIPPQLLESIQLLPIVENVRKAEVVETHLPDYRVATSSSLGTAVADLIYLPFAKMQTRGNPDVHIAVLDTGVNLDHPELEGKILKRGNFVDLEGLDTAGFIGNITDLQAPPEDEVGHGTHVSGIIAAKGLRMDEGVCPDCRIMAVRVLAAMKSGDRLVGAGIVDNINTGIKWAVDNGADIINMSLGIKHTAGGLPHEDVIRYALAKNVTIVAASGNDGSPERYFPGALPGVIAVGAVDNSGQVTPFTSYGANIYVVAPGLNIYSSYAHDTYAFASGTSQASPFVCGAIGLMKSYALEQGRKLNNDDIRSILKNCSDKIDNRLRNEKAGYGLLNLADSFKFLKYMLN